MLAYLVHTLVLGSVLQQPAPTPGAQAPVLRAAPLRGAIRLDGILSEAAWQEADSINGLTEVEPQEGGVPTGRTVVKVLAAPDALVIGVVAYDPDPGGIVTFARARDAGLRSEDHIRVVLDTFRDGRSGYVFAVNPGGARFDALVSARGESEDAAWDAVWEARAARTPLGWSVEFRLPVRSMIFAHGLATWGFNVERRIQRLQETSRWAGASRDFRVTQTSRAGLLEGLPRFRLGLGVDVRPSVTGTGGKPAPGAGLEGDGSASLDVTQRLGANLLGSLTLNTDFAETEVDTRQTNLTRFPLFFPEKRSFFLEGSDIFDFGLGLDQDVIPFFSRRIGLLGGREVPLRVGAKLNGRAGRANLGALGVRVGARDSLAPAASMGVLRLKENVLTESSAGAFATFGDPLGRGGSWTAGADFTFQTSRLQGNKNFLVGVWGLAMDRDGAGGDRTAAGLKLDYPNDLWDVALTYKRIGEDFDPSLGFVPRPGVQIARLGVEYKPRPRWGAVRQMFYEFRPSLVTDLDGRWESYRVFLAPINWRLESGDRFEFNVVPQGERPTEPFEVAEGVTIQPGPYRYTRYRLEAGLAAKRKFSGQATWWFGGFFGGTLHQLELELSWTPVPLITMGLEGEHDIGRLPGGDFTESRVGTRVRLNFSPDLELSGFFQYDSESRTFGTNARLRWTFDPLGDLFLVYNQDVVDAAGGWSLASSQLLLKTQYTFRY